MILELLDRLRREAAKLGLEFLLIGGHAVARHGHARMTLDIDFLVRAEERTLWDALLSSSASRMDSELNLPVFDRPTDDSPAPMTYEQSVEAFEEIIQTFRLREKEIPKNETIEPFVL